MKKSIMPYLALSMFGNALVNRSYIQPKHQSEPRPCLNCGEPKHHNNAYCSPECCKAHRAKRREEG